MRPHRESGRGGRWRVAGGRCPFVRARQPSPPLTAPTGRPCGRAGGPSNCPRRPFACARPAHQRVGDAVAVERLERHEQIARAGHRRRQPDGRLELQVGPCEEDAAPLAHGDHQRPLQRALHGGQLRLRERRDAHGDLRGAPRLSAWHDTVQSAISTLRVESQRHSALSTWLALSL
eukprot:7388714-Prymnesium_polylepis.3